MSKPDFNFAKMSEETNIPIFRIKEILGIPLSGTCAATTYEEAEEAYTSADSDSEEEQLALYKLVELSTTTQQAEETYDRTTPESIAQKLALKKWVELAQTFEDLTQISNYLEVNGTTEEEKLFSEKWNDFVSKGTESMSTPLEAKELSDNVIVDLKSAEAFFQKWIDLEFSAPGLQEIVEQSNVWPVEQKRALKKLATLFGYYEE